jgi:hypothetical protein
MLNVHSGRAPCEGCQGGGEREGGAPGLWCKQNPFKQTVLLIQIQLEQRKVALAGVENKQVQETLQHHLEIIKVAGGITSAVDKAVALQKEIKRLESRRQQASVKYNEAFTHCQKLRGQIDSLRRERLVFDGIYSKLDRELQVCTSRFEA